MPAAFRSAPTWIFAALCVALSVSNVLLFRKVSALDAQLQFTEERLLRAISVAPGTTVPPLSGTDPSGRRVAFAYGTDARKTVMLVYSPRCKSCDAQWPVWREIVSKIDGTKFRVVAVDQTALTTDAYLAAHRLRGLSVIARPDAATLRDYKLKATPQTVVIGPAGVVEAVWTGASIADAQRQAQSRLLEIGPLVTTVQ